jgi:UrcA family protein
MDEPRFSAVVKYGDLDLTTEVGREVLQHRIKSAAWRVCDEDAAPGMLFAEITHTVRCATKTANSASVTLRHIIANAAARSAATTVVLDAAQASAPRR